MLIVFGSADSDPGYLILSSCLGDEMRASISRYFHGSKYSAYDQGYFRTMTYTGPASLEQFEMEDMYRAQRDEEYDR